MILASGPRETIWSLFRMVKTTADMRVKTLPEKTIKTKMRSLRGSFNFQKRKIGERTSRASATKSSTHRHQSFRSLSRLQETHLRKDIESEWGIHQHPIHNPSCRSRRVMLKNDGRIKQRPRSSLSKKDPW